MNIPPKYEDLVLKVAELERREAALREELEIVSKAVPNSTLELVSLQQRLTVAEQRAGDMKSALGNLVNDCLASDFNEHWDSFKNAESALKPAAEGEVHA